MPNPPLPADLADLLARPNPAVMATVASDGRPVSVATWYLVEDDGRILLNVEDGRVRIAHLRNDGRVALTALAGEDWYSHLSIQGRVEELTADEGLVDIDRLSQHYTGKPYPIRDKARTSARIRIDRWFGWGAAARE